MGLSQGNGAWRARAQTGHSVTITMEKGSCPTWLFPVAPHGHVLQVSPDNWVHLLMDVKLKDTTKPKIERRKDLLFAASKENTTSQMALVVKKQNKQKKKTACLCSRCKRCGFDLWVGKIPWRRAWKPIPVFLPGKSMDIGAWWTTLHRVARSWTQLKWLIPHTRRTQSLSQSNVSLVAKLWNFSAKSTCIFMKRFKWYVHIYEGTWIGEWSIELGQVYKCPGSSCLKLWESAAAASFCCHSVTQTCPTLCGPMGRSMPGCPVLPYLLEFAQTWTWVHWVIDAIQPSNPLSLPSFAFSLSQHQDLFQWVSSLHQLAKVLELYIQPQSFQWIFRVDFP